MKSVDPGNVSIPEFHGYLLGAVTPRPIAFASTMDEEGNVNLSPFSFFNAFSANPPILIFSPARRAKDNTTKHTLENVKVFPEVTINIVNHRIVEQMSLSSGEYEKGVNEFHKSGLTMVESVKVKPPRVGESPVAFECKVKEVIPLGQDGGAGNLIVCEILLAHFSEEILDENQRIDPFKMDAIGRLGGNWYTRVTGKTIFALPKPGPVPGIGVDRIPEEIRNSVVLTGNDLGRSGGITTIPNHEAVVNHSHSKQIIDLKRRFHDDHESYINHIHIAAKKLIESGNIDEAWLTLLQK